MEDLIINSTDALNQTKETNRQIESFIDQTMHGLWRSRDQLSPYNKKCIRDKRKQNQETYNQICQGYQFLKQGTLDNVIQTKAM